MERNKYLITNQQHKYLFTLLSKYLIDDELIQEYKLKIKKHYNIPSTWQLTQKEAQNIINRLSTLLEKTNRKVQQIKNT
jgi:hypothetical protein